MPGPLTLHLRIGESLVVAWLAFTIVACVACGGWRPLILLKESTITNPMLTLAYVVLCAYLLPLVLISARKLAGTLGTLSGGTSPPETLNMEDETRLLYSAARFLRDCAPVYVTIFFYPSSDLLIDCLRGPALADRRLAEIDLMVFGGHASAWMERLISPTLTDVLSLCYFLHIVLPVIILLFVYFRCPRREFVEATQAFITMFLVGVTLYVLVPAVGPKYALASLYTRDLAGGTIGQLNAAVIDVTRVARDAFPSLHVGLSALLLVYAWRASRWFALCLSPVIVGNWVATIYLRYHYSIDVVAGFLLVPVVIGLVRAWAARWPEEFAV